MNENSQFNTLPTRVWDMLKKRSEADEDLKSLKDTSTAMQAGPILASASEMAKLYGGTGVNLNPALAWASGRPGAPKNLGAIAQANPYSSPSEVISRLMGMGESASRSKADYLKERDKFFATQMGRPVGAAGLAGQLEKIDRQGEIRKELQDDKLSQEEKLANKKFDQEMKVLDKKIAASASEQETQRLIKEKDKREKEEKERREAEAKAEADARRELGKMQKSKDTLVNAYEALRSIETILGKYENTGNYPGIGVGGSDIATTASKLFTNPKDAWDYIRDAQTVQAKYKELIALRNRTLSGLQSTDREFKRAIQQLGDAPWQAEEIGVKGLRDLARAMGKGLEVDFKTLSPKAQDLYRESDMYEASDFYNFNIGGSVVGRPTRKKTSGSQESGGRKETKRQYNPAQNKTRILYDDGSSEIVDGKQSK